MNRIYTSIIIFAIFGLIYSPSTAFALPSEAELFYGISLDKEPGKAISDIQPRSIPDEVDIDKEKPNVSLPDEINKPECFFGYTYQGCE